MFLSMLSRNPLCGSVSFHEKIIKSLLGDEYKVAIPFAGQLVSIYPETKSKQGANMSRNPLCGSVSFHNKIREFNRKDEVSQSPLRVS